MTAELPCCQGLPQHTYGDDCLHHREETFDIGTEDGRKALARKMAENWFDRGGLLLPGESILRLEHEERILSQEDVRRLLEGEGS